MMWYDKDVYDDLQVVMSRAEVTTSFLAEYGSTREPPAGKKFLWIHITLKNISQGEQDLPAPEHFSVLNGTTEFKSTYGHRKDCRLHGFDDRHGSRTGCGCLVAF